MNAVNARMSKIKIKPSHEGMLHTDLNIRDGQPIPNDKLQAARNSNSPAERKRAVFAINAKKWNKK